jgi:hypothetical protein
MLASVWTDALRDLWGPGLVFLALCGWLIRRALRAARNESILEEQRLREFSESAVKSISPPPANDSSPSSPPSPSPSPSPSLSPSTLASIPTSTSPLRVPPQLFRADVRGASQEHLDVLARLVAEREATPDARPPDVLWVRSNSTHMAWAEMRPGNREVICVAQIDSGKVVARWQFG